MILKLYAPDTYWNASEEEVNKICNGCGAKNGIKVPDTMYGLNISEACNIHDWMFHEGKTHGDMMFANAMFILNLTNIILHGSNRFTRTFRLMRAEKYFLAVCLYGEDAYWIGRYKNEHANITYKGSFR